LQLKRDNLDKMENFSLLEKKENPLFNRKEIKAYVEAEITPSLINVKKLISEKFSTSPENIKIKNILGKFGSKTFRITANIYDSKKDKDNIEPEKAGKKVEKQEEVQESPEEKPVEKTEKSPKPQPIEELPKEKDIDKQNPPENIDNKLNQSSEPEASENKSEQ